MQKLSNRLTRELTERGNLPISADGIVKLRPDLANNFSAAQAILSDEIVRRTSEPVLGKNNVTRNDVLEAKFAAGPAGTSQKHLFMLEEPRKESDGERIKRWSRMPVSYGSFVQVEKFLKQAWGEVRNLELKLARVQLNED